jgi:hypothetical protein
MAGGKGKAGPEMDEANLAAQIDADEGSKH